MVALANEASGRRLETFSIGFDEARYDERKHARYVADKFGTRHHEFLLEPGSIEILEQIAWHVDEPFADSSALPTWYLSQLTRQHVKVALSAGSWRPAGVASCFERFLRLPILSVLS